MPASIQLGVPRALGLFWTYLLFLEIINSGLLTVSADRPLKPLTEEMSVVINSSITEPLELGQLSRVDPNATSPAPVKIMDLIPTESIFHSYRVSSTFIMKMLSKEQTAKVVEMLANGSYVRFLLSFQSIFVYIFDYLLFSIWDFKDWEDRVQWLLTVGHS